MQTHLIIVEYPKSGGSWLVSLLGDALNMPKRDIYVSEGYDFFDITHHPWYRNSPSWNITEPSIIKSHELPSSSLHHIENKTIHLVRDGRDVVVSKFFYESEFCVKNGLYQSFNTPWGEYVQKTATDWSRFVNDWLATGIKTIHYEELVTDTFRTITSICNYLNIPVNIDERERAIKNNSKEKFKESLADTFVHNTFVRKGIIGDWKNHFSDSDLEVFCQIAGESMEALGYSSTE